MKSFRRQQRPRKSTLIGGFHAVIEALRDGLPLDRIYIDRDLKNSEAAELRRMAAPAGVPINVVPGVKLNSFHLQDHAGVIAQKSRVQYQQLQDVISHVVEEGQVPLFLVLDGITDIRNIGGIARTAYGMGVHAIIIPDKGVGALNEDAVLTSAGALELISICRVNSLLKAIDELHMNGIRVFATEMKASTIVSKATLSVPCAIVMGSEEKGIYPALLKSCDEKISIPMPGNFESLNVSVATGIILYEVQRQRSAG
jgi:23S rRNA (guanosine2251-2'-O)-methyltransferase